MRGYGNKTFLVQPLPLDFMNNTPQENTNMTALDLTAITEDIRQQVMGTSLARHLYDLVEPDTIPVGYPPDATHEVTISIPLMDDQESPAAIVRMATRHLRTELDKKMLGAVMSKKDPATSVDEAVHMPATTPPTPTPPTPCIQPGVPLLIGHTEFTRLLQRMHNHCITWIPTGMPEFIGEKNPPNQMRVVLNPTVENQIGTNTQAAYIVSNTNSKAVMIMPDTTIKSGNTGTMSTLKCSLIVHTYGDNPNIDVRLLGTRKAAQILRDAAASTSGIRQNAQIKTDTLNLPSRRAKVLSSMPVQKA